MTSHVVRLYAAALALLGFFVAWAAIAAHPWRSAAPATADPRLAALRARERALRQDAVLLQRLAARGAGASASAQVAPAVKVASLPPLTITRTS